MHDLQEFWKTVLLSDREHNLILSTMKYEKVWRKVLADDETVQYEFSIGDKYRRFRMILWVLVTVWFVFPIPFVLFYFGYYLRVANAYAFTNRRVLAHRGWLSTDMLSVDYAKITDVRVVEPFLDRIFTKTGNITINTAGPTSDQITLMHVQAPYDIKKRLDALKDAV